MEDASVEAEIIDDIEFVDILVIPHSPGVYRFLRCQGQQVSVCRSVEGHENEGVSSCHQAEEQGSSAEGMD